MSRVPTAQLSNARMRITLHRCIRLEVRGEGRERGIYPVYRCVETGRERDFGCLKPSTSTRQLGKLFPHVELVYVEDDQADDELAA